MCCFEKLFKYKALFQILCQSNVSKHEDEIEDCVLFDLSGLEVQFQSSELWKHFRVTSLQMGIIFKSAKLLNDRTLGILKFCPHLCGAFEDQVYCGEEPKTWYKNLQNRRNQAVSRKIFILIWKDFGRRRFQNRVAKVGKLSADAKMATKFSCQVPLLRTRLRRIRVLEWFELSSEGRWRWRWRASWIV